MFLYFTEQPYNDISVLEKGITELLFFESDIKIIRL